MDPKMIPQPRIDQGDNEEKPNHHDQRCDDDNSEPQDKSPSVSSSSSVMMLTMNSVVKKIFAPCFGAVDIDAVKTTVTTGADSSPSCMLAQCRPSSTRDTTDEDVNKPQPQHTQHVQNTTSNHTHKNNRRQPQQQRRYKTTPDPNYGEILTKNTNGRMFYNDDDVSTLSAYTLEEMEQRGNRPTRKNIFKNYYMSPKKNYKVSKTKEAVILSC